MYRLFLSFYTLLTASLCTAQRAKTRPDIFFVSIGSCVYANDPATAPVAPGFFPEYIDIQPLLKGIERDYEAYEHDPVVIRRNDSLSQVLHEVTWDQPEIAHRFAEDAAACDSMPGDRYINRCDGSHRIRKQTIRGNDTTESLEPPSLIDTFTGFSSVFFDSSDFSGAKKSAAKMGELFSRQGGRGFVISSYDEPVSRNMFFAAIDSIWKIIRAAHPAHPILLFYYCGHGYGDSFGRRFLVPGTFTGELNRMPLPMRRLRSVFVRDLYNYLSLTGYPFMLLLDCCSENQGTPPRDNIDDYYEQIAINADGAELTRMVYSHFFQPTGPYSVIYSSRLGKNSLPVQDPVQPTSATYIGPLCRRLQIASQHTPGLFRSLDRLQQAIIDTRLDPSTAKLGIYCPDCPQTLLPAKADP